MDLKMLESTAIVTDSRFEITKIIRLMIVDKIDD